LEAPMWALIFGIRDANMIFLKEKFKSIEKVMNGG